ncbi:3-deoxy-7-phosphoheptulonate synthase [Latilactobacillus curvatus]|uniref:3-deoxy-7-phosphoheptulonate synthase n=1 Tax=Latilactobacillus curvatus TaxID=28038 RepID=UPI0009773565|nr:3-deoxy-7-phosphoheptulonate synthase [Latilactobacillus curvatus]MCT3525290.1 3-deoxy-7-phosphoheptulonate synthase [Latilactobacillus curvatus]UTB70482.1 3-deoxy-7-phosphoheptulonate synthase [Latilactobacillus curvatus]UTB74252.1 3-deoxy-7-phosphoheptulonate synthase [Latilactobacillus curvatus]
MIIQFKPSTDSALIDAFCARQRTTNPNVYQIKHHVAVIGAKAIDFTPAEEEVIAATTTDEPSYVLGSRLFQPENTVIELAHSTIGGADFTVMAGPCSVETADHIMAMAKVAKEGGATILRGGAYKPRTSPYSFQGMGEAGLKALRKAADAYQMDVVTEVMDETHVDLVAQYTDIFQIGARNMQNFSLLKAVGKTNVPVALKRGLAATVDDLLNAAEYIAANGNQQIMLLERGIRTFDNHYTRNTFDLNAVPVLQKLTHYPVLIDPSHATGEWDLVTPMARAGVATGASGLQVEIHDHPEKAFSDGAQALKPATYLEMCHQVWAVDAIVKQWRH